MKVFDRVLVRKADEPWYPEIFSHYEKDKKFPYVCAYGSFKHCILFEENRKLFSSNTKDFQPFQPVLVRDDENEPWTGDLFAKFNKGKFDCVFSNWKYCIPYFGNESLLPSEEGFSPFEEVLIKYEDNPSFSWNIDFFIGFNKDSSKNHKYHVISGYYSNCVKFVGNEHLLGEF